MATRNTRTPLGREKIKRPGWGARFLETNGRSNAGLRPGGEAPPRADEAAQRSETQFRGLTELSADWYWEQDQHYRFTFISNGFNEKTGRDPATYLGRTRWDEPALNLDGAQWDRHRAQLERRESFRDFEIQRIAPDGRAVWVSVSGEPIVAEGGAFTGYRGVGRDITRRSAPRSCCAWSTPWRAASATRARCRRVCRRRCAQCARWRAGIMDAISDSTRRAAS